MKRISFLHAVLVHMMVLLLLTMPCTQAGDILHMSSAGTGAGTGTTGTSAADAVTVNAAAATAEARANAQDMLARNTMALQAVTAMQDAAHAAAAGATNAGANPNFPGQTLPDVPNGLATGGLEIIGTPTGANSPTQSLQNAHTIVTIQQTQQQALLTWKTFNVGSDTTVKFDQSAGGADAGNWIAFNKITDPSGNPTQILGSIEAQGQVYLINQNGIIFGAGSEVNTHAMVASALPLNDNLVSRGLLNNPDSQFLFSANAQAAGTKGPTPAYTPPAPPSTPGGKIGDVTVQTGARITAPTSSANVGGRVVLVGPNVTNNGTISTPDGQTILAAGMEIGFAAHASTDASLRGLDVYVGSVGTYGGTVTNAGLIDAPRGSVAMVGKNVNENGVIESTTTAALNGRIDLRASYDSIPNTFYDPVLLANDLPFVQKSTGVVKMAAGAVMQILPEWDNPLTVVGTELALKSQVNIVGQTVYLGTGSTVYAPNANVAISAGVWVYNLLSGGTTNDLITTSGQVYMDQDAVVDVQGSTDIEVPLDQYLLTVTLHAAELANSPLQRNSFLRGQTITVDLRNTGTRADGSTWYGTPLADLSGYVGIIQRTVGELTTAGGNVTVSAGSSFVMQSGAKVDVSGGWINFQGSDVQTTRLVVSGQVVDISQADPSVAYDAIYTGSASTTDARYSVTSTSAAMWRGNSYYDNGYLQGNAGGTLSITAPAMALDGDLVGLTASGPLQEAHLATPASLSLKWESTTTGKPSYLFTSPTPPAIQFSSTLTQTAADAFSVNGSGVAPALRQDRRDTVVLSPDLVGKDGFGRLSIVNYDGSILLAAGETLQLTPQGSLSLSGANVTVEGSIIAPGGSISLAAYNISPATMAALALNRPTSDPAVNSGRGVVTVGSAAVLSTAGLVANQSLASASQLYQPIVTGGGSISVSGYSVDMAQGSVVDVSGGVHVTPLNQFLYGDAGSITIAAAQNPAYSYLQFGQTLTVKLLGIIGGSLTLGSELKGFSGAQGGTLGVQAQMIQIGGTSANPLTLVLAPAFFSTGGFTQYNLTGLGQSQGGGTYLPGISVTAGTTVSLQAQGYVASKATDGSGAVTLSPTTAAEGVRRAASLQLTTPGVADDFSGLLLIRSSISMGAGSSITTDATGTVKMKGQTGTILGSISAPGGTIDLSFAIKYPSDTDLPNALPTLYLGAGASLSTAGKTVLVPDAYGRNFGTVYDGGTVNLTGNLVMAAGAVVDVSGTSGVVDVLPQYVGGSGVVLNQQTVQSVREDSNGGSINIAGGEEFYVDGTLKANAGGSTAQGGTLTLSSGEFIPVGSFSDPRDITLWITQSGPTLSAAFAGIGNPVRDGLGAVAPAAGHMAADTFQNGGFDSLTLKGNVGFVGAVNITARGAISAGSGGIIQTNDAVHLTASYVSLGLAFANPLSLQDAALPLFNKTDANGTNPLYFSPTYGSGSLTVTAKLIDVGTLTLLNTGALNLQAYDGEIRGDGYLEVAGGISLTAAQIYPPTAVKFQIVAYDYLSGGVTTQGSITVTGSGQHALPLSAGGTLNLYASKIVQGGTLVAPFGTINLGWDGLGGWDGAQTAPTDLVTNLTVPVTSQLTLTSTSVTTVSAVDRLTGQALIIPYGINLNGTNWIDPHGTDITTGGGPTKAIHIAAQNVTTAQGSIIDVAGGGDLYAYRWVSGNGGTTDVLADSGSFAVLADYAASFAPFGAYNSTAASTATLGTDKGYTNSTLQVGDQVYLGASSGLAAGVYTLLPARYALLPGGFLVTPSTAAPVGSTRLPSTAYQVNGYRVSGLNSDPGVPAVVTAYEVASGALVRQRAEYDEFTAGSFLKAQALTLGVTVPELPQDAGHAVFQAVQTMQLQGTVLGQAATGGNGALVDISSPVDIVISAPGAPVIPGKLQLSAAGLSAIGAGSLLIGGVRYTATDGTHITVRTNNLTVDDAGTPLSGPEVLLVANQVLTVSAGSVISQSAGSAITTAETLILGNTTTAGSGNGALVRVSSNANATITRVNRTGSTLPSLIVGANAVLQGTSLTLDTTYGTSLASSAVLNGANIALNSGSVILQLDSTLTGVPSTPGLLLLGPALQSLSTAQSLSLLSYGTFDTYGAGTVGNASLANLSIHAAQIRGFSQGTGTVSFVAQNILLDNSAGGSTAAASGNSGTLALSTGLLRLGTGTMLVNQFSTVQIQATTGIQLEGTGGLSTDGAAHLTTPYITGLAGATQTITAANALLIDGANATPAAAGLGASLTLQGQSVEVDTMVKLPSGLFSATATGGSLTVNGTLDAGGVKVSFQDVDKYTSGGQISLASSTGNVTISSTAKVNVSANSGGGNAGFVNISAPLGTFNLPTPANLTGTGGSGGLNGTLTLDVGSLGTLTLGSLSGPGSASFTESLSVRVRTGDVTISDSIKAHQFQLAADAGSITVSKTGVINASGSTGGTIRLVARKDVVLQGDSGTQTGAALTVAGQTFDSAGKGGLVSLEAGAAALVSGTYAAGTGTVDIQKYSSINLSVAAQTSSSAGLGQFSGVLHLRAPQVSAPGGGLDVTVNAIQGTITGASSVTVEGYFIQDLTSSGGTITSTVQSNVQNNGLAFITNNTNYTTMLNRILANTGLGSLLVIQPGAEIVNRTGDLTLGTTSSTTTSDWNLATYRYGTNQAPGVLTLRAAGNLVFYNALSDGFTPTLANSNSSWLWLAPVTTAVSTLPMNTQSWSYRLTAGADLSAVDFHGVQALSQLGATSGSLQLGKNGGQALPTTLGDAAQTSTALAKLYQVIRTGTGDIDISAGRDVQLLNQFATIYTAGVGLPNPTHVVADNDFGIPVVTNNSQAVSQGTLGSLQQQYGVYYTMAGGNVLVYAQNDIIHLTRNTSNVLIADSERQMPTNWLYRRGFVDTATGLFGANGTTGPPLSIINDPTASTTWWVDFSNFFEGVGALGGGNVTLKAGHDVTNVDAVAPTNARMAGKDPGTGLNVAPDANKFVELGGGNVTVLAGRNVDGGVYYVERGQGVIQAGGSITTNATRTMSMGLLSNLNNPQALDSRTWLPTTLFVGKGSFDVSARLDVLLGPVANPFLLPQGLNNRFWNKTYFSTYGSTSGVSVASTAGTVTLREASNSNSAKADPILYNWYSNVLLYSSSAPLRPSYDQPWLRTDETSMAAFQVVAALMPGTLKATSFSSGINVVGTLTLSPSATGTLSLLAATSINGLQSNGTSNSLVTGKTVVSWGSATINLSDANPASVPGAATPFAYASLSTVGKTTGNANVSQSNFLSFINALFNETGSTTGTAAVLQTKQALHAPGVLHAADTTPVYVYANSGDISGITMYTPKATRVYAGNDLTDIALYIQNATASSLSVVAAGRDIIAYNDSTATRTLARSTGNALVNGAAGPTLAGDIQISGGGSLEVLAGRNINLGTGSTNSNGTGVGITSIGNGRNPYLPFAGADLVVAAGAGAAATGMGGTAMDFASFISYLSSSGTGARYLAELADLLGVPSVNLNDPTLTPEQQKQLALAVYYLALRDAGRDHNDANSPNVGTYSEGYAAIAKLFPTPTAGSILTQARNIRTQSGGDISILTPDGGLQMASTTIGSTLAPPGIITDTGGNINIFADGSVDIGIARIFTLRGGDIMIWSSTGDIAAGSSSKTVQSAPPTRVLIDPQSANVSTDLAGLATGGGIGVLATVAGVRPGNVDLIAPVGAVDAGDAGIRATGNLNIAATIVLNASNISVGGTSAGTPAAPAVAAPSLGGLASAASAGAATTGSNAQAPTQGQPPPQTTPQDQNSTITVEVLGYGGGSGTNDDRKRTSDQPGE
ncbi:filamentous haemagglutinin family protein [Prosthecobacter sp.]|uniref:filamentous haemagglutinin family protein n=1 Tax=Prosthecobacter sp. TaxID=1965333 RepID=UPI003782EAEF